MISPLRLSILASTASVLVLAGTGLGAPESVVERQVAEAFERIEQQRGGPSASVGIDRSHLHLSRLPEVTTVPPALAVGDRITLAARSGGSAAYEVTEVRRLASGDGEPRLMLIVAVDASQVPAATLRFVIDADAPTALVPPRALAPL